MDTDTQSAAPKTRDDLGTLGLVEPPILSSGSGLRGPDSDYDVTVGNQGIRGLKEGPLTIAPNQAPDEHTDAIADQLIPENPDGHQRRPYADQTLSKIKELAPYIRVYATRYEVPPLAVAGAIANEYDTRFDDRPSVLLHDPNAFRKGFPKAFSHYDQFQDSYVPRLMPEGGSAVKRLDNWLIPTYAGSPGWMNNDIGPANIHLATALQLWQDHPEELPASVHDYTSLARYVVSNQGTAQLSAKYISWAKRDFDKSLSSTDMPLSPDDKAALYVDYFRKGAEKLNSEWSKRLQQTYGDKANDLLSGAAPLSTDELPQPYDGVRAVVNKHALLGALAE